MKKLFTAICVVFLLTLSVSAQNTFIPIPSSQFPQVSMPSNDMRFMMVYPRGGLSANPLLASNATISWANLIIAVENTITNGGGGGSATNAYHSQTSDNTLIISTNTGQFIYTFRVNTNVMLSQSAAQVSYKSGTNAYVGNFTETNSQNVFPMFNVGVSQANSFTTFGFSGLDTLDWRFADGGIFINNPNNVNLALWGNNGINGLVFKDTSLTDNRGGAPYAIDSDYVQGSGSSLTGIMPKGPEIWQAKRHAFLGLYTDIIGEGDTPSSFILSQKPYTNLVNVAKFFNTNGINSALAQYGIRTWIFGDQGWSTNRTSSGALRFDPNVLSTAGATTESNYVAMIHTNGVMLSLHIYYSSTPFNHFNGDTERVFQNNIDVSYPSGLTGNNPYWSEITPETVAKDISWFYTNRIDEIYRADTSDYQFLQGYEQQLAALDYYIQYPLVSIGVPVYWKAITNFTVLSQFPVSQGTISNQLIFGSFVNRASFQTVFEVNAINVDQIYPTVSPNTLSGCMAYARTYNDSMSNWPPATVFPFFSDVNFDQNNSALPKASWTNFYSVAEMFHADTAVDIDTNSWTWNVNQTAVVTNSPVFLWTWMENTLAWPHRMFDDGTNSLWVRNIDNGWFLVLGANESSSSSNYNFNIAGLGGITTNVIYNVTNVLAGDNPGFLTNSFIFTIPAQSCVYQLLAPSITPSGLPANGPGVLTNNGSGSINWDSLTNYVKWTNQPTSFQVGQFLVIAGTNSSGSLEVTNYNLPSQTNFVGATNWGAWVAGQMLVITGTNALGVLQVMPTNIPNTVAFISTDPLTNHVYGSNIIVGEEVILPSSNQTNFPINMATFRKKEVNPNGTNINFSFSNIATNYEVDIYIDNTLGSNKSIVTWPAHIVQNNGALNVVTNGQSYYYHIDVYNGVDPTNCIVTGGDYYKHL